MPSVRIIYDVDGWAYHHRVKALMRYAPSDFTVSATALRGIGSRRNMDAVMGSEPSDLFLVMVYSAIGPIRDELQRRNWNSRLVLAWSNGWPYRAWECCESYQLSDHMIVNNFGAWNGLGRLPRTSMIPNGVDLTTFRVMSPLNTRSPKVIWVGSVYHRQTKSYDSLLLPLRETLHQCGIACELMLVDSFNPAKRSPEQMAEWYNQGTVYVCASKTEGTPNTALEAAACGCTVVTTRVGNMEQLIQHDINGMLVESNFESLLKGIREANERYLSLAEKMQESISAWDWSERAQVYYTLLRKLISNNDRSKTSTRKTDLSSSVTVFVTTVGAPTFRGCMARLRDQSCVFSLNVIQDVAPMSLAYQTMIERCRTPFYVQVDEDMLLHPYAIEFLFLKMQEQDLNTAMVVAELYDCDLERRIYGVKLFRHQIVKNYPFANVEATDVHQNARMKKDGYRIELLKLKDTPKTPAGVLGLHGVKWSDKTIYERYATQKRRYRRRPDKERWFLDHELDFFNRFREAPNRHNFFALMGTIAGTLWPLNGSGEEKDCRRYDRLPGFDEVNAFFNRIAQLMEKKNSDLKSR